MVKFMYITNCRCTLIGVYIGKLVNLGTCFGSLGSPFPPASRLILLPRQAPFMLAPGELTDKLFLLMAGQEGHESLLRHHF